MNSTEIRETIEYYRLQGVPQDQQVLIAMLREMQEAEGGALSMPLLEETAAALGIKASMLQAIIRRVPSLRLDTARHRLEVCGTCKAGAKLRGDVERTYGVKSGAIHEKKGFSYHVTPCMKNCRNGPSIRWDGVLYSRADTALVFSLIEKE